MTAARNSAVHGLDASDKDDIHETARTAVSGVHDVFHPHTPRCWGPRLVYGPHGKTADPKIRGPRYQMRAAMNSFSWFLGARQRTGMSDCSEWSKLKIRRTSAAPEFVF